MEELTSDVLQKWIKSKANFSLTNKEALDTLVHFQEDIYFERKGRGERVILGDAGEGGKVLPSFDDFLQELKLRHENETMDVKDQLKNIPLSDIGSYARKLKILLILRDEKKLWKSISRRVKMPKKVSKRKDDVNEKAESVHTSTQNKNHRHRSRKA